MDCGDDDWALGMLEGGRKGEWEGGRRKEKGIRERRREEAKESG